MFYSNIHIQIIQIDQTVCQSVLIFLSPNPNRKQKHSSKGFFIKTGWNETCFKGSAFLCVVLELEFEKGKWYLKIISKWFTNHIYCCLYTRLLQRMAKQFTVEIAFLHKFMFEETLKSDTTYKFNKNQTP